MVAGEIRANPQLAEPRALFVQVLCMEGEWERAAAQADALLRLSPASALFCTTVSGLIAAEQQRARVFAGECAPEWAGPQPAYAADVCAALRAYGSGDTAAAAAATRRVTDALEPVPAALDGAAPQPWLIDADARLAGVVEYLKDGHYCLVGQGEIKSLELAAPTHPVELLWPHVRICLRSGDVLVGRTTGRYPLGGEEEPALLAMQESAWQEPAPDLYLGSGQHCWATEEGVVPVLTVSRIEFS